MCCCKGGGYKIGDKWIRSGLNSRRSADHNQIISWWSAPILALPKPHIPQIFLPLLRHYASLTLRCSSTSTTSQKYEGSLDQTHNCASFSHKILTLNLFLVKQKIKAKKLWNSLEIFQSTNHIFIPTSSMQGQCNDTMRSIWFHVKSSFSTVGD